ncbi:MAG: 1-aminocyclopropane-1-carboxylate deaminase/D-cysteine desulfhydrase [Ignavibacteriae bacterium]|nr:1-aminocyclopropane-1-carboxylate deaminase/D-cysteine desulfhydrase [Ignavibacteriota bacterium]
MTQNISQLIKLNINEDAAVLQKVKMPFVDDSVEVYLKREDLLHKTISGNKWRKLKYNLLQAEKDAQSTLLTFGGAYSNHIHATSGAGKIFGFKTIGVIRGEEHLPLNSTLTSSINNGMEIHYVDRTSYREKREKYFIDQLHHKFGGFYHVPEGGTNNLAVKGCTEIIEDINVDFDYIFSGCGTGGTFSGLVCGLGGKKNAIGVSALKGADFLNKEISGYIKNYSGNDYNNWELKLNYHFGGFAKIKKDLIEYMLEFEKENNILLEYIYTSKMIFAIYDMIKNGELKKGSRVIALHTGGLQGREGMEKYLNKVNY